MSALPAPLPDWRPVCQLALDAVTSPATRAAYARALADFLAWREAAGRPAFTRAALQAHRASLLERGLAPSTINVRLAAIKKLAREAAANGLLDAGTAAGILQTPGARETGNRAGNWLTREQAEQLLHQPDASTLKGKRDRALLALLVGCGLRRGEVAALTVDHIQERDGRGALVDLRGKHGRVRTVPVPAWVKTAIDAWREAAGVGEGKLFRAVNRHGAVTGPSLSAQAVFYAVCEYSARIGVPARPHDLRRTCAKLCRSRGGELEQIQLLLGHASIQTTERYLGTRQDLRNAPNDRLGIRWKDAPE
jgi:integrase